jgi:hypothetical protein
VLPDRQPVPILIARQWGVDSVSWDDDDLEAEFNRSLPLTSPQA